MADWSMVPHYDCRVTSSPASFVTRLPSFNAATQQFVPTQWHGSTSTHLPADLRSASHAYVRRDGYKPPLTRPYAGPFRVLSRSDKHFTLEINGKTEEITIDRLKPAKFEQALTGPAPVPRPPYADVPSSPPLPPNASTAGRSATLPCHCPTPPPPTTRSGRVVRRPTHFQGYVID